jgi:hypothetical protein
MDASWAPVTTRTLSQQGASRRTAAHHKRNAPARQQQLARAIHPAGQPAARMMPVTPEAFIRLPIEVTRPTGLNRFGLTPDHVLPDIPSYRKTYPFFCPLNGIAIMDLTAEPLSWYSCLAVSRTTHKGVPHAKARHGRKTRTRGSSRTQRKVVSIQRRKRRRIWLLLAAVLMTAGLVRAAVRLSLPAQAPSVQASATLSPAPAPPFRHLPLPLPSRFHPFRPRQIRRPPWRPSRYRRVFRTGIPTNTITPGSPLAGWVCVCRGCEPDHPDGFALPDREQLHGPSGGRVSCQQGHPDQRGGTSPVQGPGSPAAAGASLIIHDAYRPTRAVDDFVRWGEDLSDQAKKQAYYPDIPKQDILGKGFLARKSSHSRGSTVDVSIVSLETGDALDMGYPFDWFGPESHPDYEDLTDTQRKNRCAAARVDGTGRVCDFHH